MAKTNVPAVAEEKLPVPVADADDMNFFNSYGNTAAMTTIKGQLLKFDKGDWLLGADGSEVSKDKQFTAVMDELMIGWTKWQDNKPVATDMGPLASGFIAAKRNSLGDLDEAEWEKDDKDVPRDPWQFTNTLILREPGTNGEDEATEVYTFPTSSRGGINFMGELCKKYVTLTKQNGKGYPILTLSMEAYNHPTYGRVKKPVFEVVGWEPKVIEAPKKVEAPKAAAKGKKK